VVSLSQTLAGVFLVDHSVATVLGEGFVGVVHDRIRVVVGPQCVSFPPVVFIELLSCVWEDIVVVDIDVLVSVSSRLFVKETNQMHCLVNGDTASIATLT